MVFHHPPLGKASRNIYRDDMSATPHVLLLTSLRSDNCKYAVVFTNGMMAGSCRLQRHTVTMDRYSQSNQSGI
jgi:hypothetical protein